MNEIFHRISVRKYEDTPVEPDKIEQLLRAAMAAPSAFNQQPWEFYVVTNRSLIEQLSTVTRVKICGCRRMLWGWAACGSALRRWKNRCRRWNGCWRCRPVSGHLRCLRWAIPPKPARSRIALTPPASTQWNKKGWSI